LKEKKEELKKKSKEDRGFFNRIKSNKNSEEKDVKSKLKEEEKNISFDNLPDEDKKSIINAVEYDYVFF
jgi:hypothetical protein